MVVVGTQESWQTGRQKHSDQQTEAEELVREADPRGAGRGLCPKGSREPLQVWKQDKDGWRSEL